ncbi:hypothetical protein ACEXQD_08070 [Herbiconiux sp. P15]|uniref:hypothetical protein n=1 Tax=Herbiconiux liukaitaii TaxID=3342799 RepID=UPI0035B8ADE5
MSAATAPSAASGSGSAPGTRDKRGFSTFGRSGWAVALIFAFLYAYHVWGGIANLVGVVATFSEFGAEVTGGVWALIIGYAVVPIVVYLVALLVGRRMRNAGRAVVFVVGFTVVSVISLDILALA